MFVIILKYLIREFPEGVINCISIALLKILNEDEDVALDDSESIFQSW